VNKPKYIVRLLRVAEDDFNEMITYIAAENRAAAEMIATKIEKNLIRLSFYPYLGKIPKDEELSRLGYRFLVVENYLIFYTIEEQTILIHRIIHGARNYLNLF
jgi:toxin ParE1/3/4